MRAAVRLLASVSRTPANYLTAGAPTGITGVITHPFPRPALLWLYTSTLDKLTKIPESSVYRTSTEALTKHRLNIVSAVEPAGFSDWQVKVKDEYIPLLEKEKHSIAGAPELIKRIQFQGKPYLYRQLRTIFVDERELEWDGEPGAELERGEGVRSLELREKQMEAAAREQERQERKVGVEIENEPPLTANQVSEIEQKIGGGLIEEIIQVAQHEHDLVDTMIEAKVWEELEEKPAPGQWTYFERE